MSAVPHTLTPRNAALLLIPPLLWAGNAVVGRMIADLIPPLTLNFIRWALAFVLLLPLAHRMLRRTSPLWAHWKHYAVLGLLGVGCYNSLLYLALQTSTPINVTLVGSSMPVFMLLVGALFFKQTVRKRQMAGALLSILGVLVVLCRGDWQALANVHLVVGDVFVLIATACWSWYSWLLARTQEPTEARSNWANFLMSQMVFGLFWSAAFSGAEWSGFTGLSDRHISLGWPLVAALVYVAVGPSLLAYRCWGLGVQRVGPNIAGFFVNLIPVFTATLSALVLGEMPQVYHAAAFALIIGGIVVSSRK
ncbi:DMT family transporter [Limnohabitans sp. INBF002]|uniref:DMT family transporter n=1 Tax=Limnohabitans sp. INBF002 TaxID=2986280 RepID=UPI002376E4FF|nr:DMT family transporter [Limnohabitans sp. INBF002]BDU53850.1 permease [Limnohabitans sp. INBF002]